MLPLKQWLAFQPLLGTGVGLLPVAGTLPKPSSLQPLELALSLLPSMPQKAP